MKNKNYFKQKAREHYERNRERLLQKFRQERLKVIRQYGGKCVCCGEKQIEFLALDHRNNDGAKHRKEVGGQK